MDRRRSARLTAGSAPHALIRSRPGPGHPGRHGRAHDAAPQRPHRGSQHQAEQKADLTTTDFTLLRHRILYRNDLRSVTTEGATDPKVRQTLLNYSPSVAAVLDGERGRWRRRAGLLYQSRIGCFLGRPDQGRGSSSAMFSRYLMAFTCASGVVRRRARSARRRISVPGFSGSSPRCPDQMAILVKSSEYSSLRAHRALASGCRICPRSICEICGLGIPVRRSTSRRLHPR